MYIRCHGVMYSSTPLQNTDDLGFGAFWSPILSRSFLVSLYTSPLWIFARPRFESKITCTKSSNDFLSHGTSIAFCCTGDEGL